ncbi:MAG: DUF6527 family protein [Terriglobia bacterium]
MKREMVLKHEFVEYIPNDLKDGTIYVSMAFATAVHICCCGCGNEVITPLSPTDWKLIFDGQTISFDPSIGNWSFACRSHYWIRRNKVVWARRWSRQEVEAGRLHDRLAKRRYFNGTQTSTGGRRTPSK